MKFIALTLFALVAAVAVEGRAVRDVKSDLIAKGNELIKTADAAVQKLTGALKAQEAAIVKTEEARIRALVTELETATAQTAITRIEAELRQAEQKLAFEIGKVNSEVPKTPVARDVKSDLIAKGNELIKTADAAVQKLTGALKAQEAAIVKTEEARIRGLVAELEAATAPAVVTRLEGELRQAEQRLAFEIEKVNREAPKTPVTRDLKSDLITKGQALIKEADAAVQKLTGAQRVAELAIVRAEEQAIRRLIAELEAITATDSPQLQRVERELQAAENRLAAEVAKIGGTNPTGPVVPGSLNKEALITKGQALIKQADEAVAKLTGNQKNIEGAVVRAEENAIRALITELEAATDNAVVARIEAQLNRAEQRLAAEIKKIEAELAPKVPVV